MANNVENKKRWGSTGWRDAHGSLEILEVAVWCWMKNAPGRLQRHSWALVMLLWSPASCKVSFDLNKIGGHFILALRRSFICSRFAAKVTLNHVEDCVTTVFPHALNSFLPVGRQTIINFRLPLPVESSFWAMQLAGRTRQGTHSLRERLLLCSFAFAARHRSKGHGSPCRDSPERCGHFACEGHLCWSLRCKNEGKFQEQVRGEFFHLLDPGSLFPCQDSKHLQVKT